LIEEELAVLVVQSLLGLDDGSEIRLHEFRNHIDAVEVIARARELDSDDRDNIVMLDETEDFEFSESALGKCGVLKSLFNLFDSHLTACNCVFSGDNNPVSTTAYGVNNPIPSIQVEGRA
jgi:hypothetical protein